MVIDISQAQSDLSRLLDEIEHGHEREIVIVRNGEPVARLVPVTETPVYAEIDRPKLNLTKVRAGIQADDADKPSTDA